MMDSHTTIEAQPSIDTFGDDFGGERMWGLLELAVDFDVSWLPQTYGWWVALSGFLVIGCLSFYRRRQEWLALGYYRESLLELDKMRSSSDNIIKLPQLLKACALKKFPRAEIASLTGHDWISWLNEQVDGTLFLATHVDVLNALNYQDNPCIDSQDLLDLIDASDKWLRDVHA